MLVKFEVTTVESHCQRLKNGIFQATKVQVVLRSMPAIWMRRGEVGSSSLGHFTQRVN